MTSKHNSKSGAIPNSKKALVQARLYWSGCSGHICIFIKNFPQVQYAQ